MAGETFLPQGFYRIPEGHQGLMGIRMALQAVCDLKMRLIDMTGNTGGDGVFLFGRMLRMATEAANLRGMSAA